MRQQLRYMGDILAWIHQSLANEYEFARRLLRGARTRRARVSTSAISDASGADVDEDALSAADDDVALRADLVRSRQKKYNILFLLKRLHMNSDVLCYYYIVFCFVFRLKSSTLRARALRRRFACAPNNCSVCHHHHHHLQHHHRRLRRRHRHQRRQRRCCRRRVHSLLRQRRSIVSCICSISIIARWRDCCRPTRKWYEKKQAIIIKHFIVLIVVYGVFLFTFFSMQNDFFCVCFEG